MIPNESLGKEVHTVNVFSLHQAMRLLQTYPCVYYSCREYERAAHQASTFVRRISQNGLENKIIVRRVGRRVVAERGPEFTLGLIDQVREEENVIFHAYTLSSDSVDNWSRTFEDSEEED